MSLPITLTKALSVITVEQLTKLGDAGLIIVEQSVHEADQKELARLKDGMNNVLKVCMEIKGYLLAKGIKINF